MVSYTEDGQQDFLRNLPESFWKVSGYDFGEDQVWEPTPDDFEVFYGEHEALVALMFNPGFKEILRSDTAIPRFRMNGPYEVDVRGFRERGLAQRIGFQVDTNIYGTRVDFSHDIVRPTDIQNFWDNPEIGLYNDGAPGKIHTSKAQIFLPPRGPIEVSYQGRPILNRPENELTPRVITNYEITDVANPFLEVNDLEAQLLLSKFVAYVNHFSKAA